MPLLELDYALVDVFAERPLEGNMLAIFTDARGLSGDQMQALARETNLSETTFLLPSAAPQPGEPVRVRIFTTGEELPFAGHPTLGTASWLYWNHPTLRGASSITLELNSGPITVRFERPLPDEVGVRGTMRQHDPIFGRTHSAKEIASTLGLSLDDLDATRPIQTVSTGMPFCIVPIRSLAAIERLAIPQVAAQAWLDANETKFFYCIAPADPASGAHFHTRMQFYNGEDPATGSASGCAISYLVQHGIVPSGRLTIFEQGIEMHRPSRIHVQATLHEGKVFDVFVGGRTIPVATGRFSFPVQGDFPQPRVIKLQQSRTHEEIGG
jgi:trans-2,3-dihydro-3-hydroxyanthranilate isomerase